MTLQLEVLKSDENFKVFKMNKNHLGYFLVFFKYMSSHFYFEICIWHEGWEK